MVRSVEHTVTMSEGIEPGSIVVAVDGSEHADRAVEWAAEQAQLENRPLVAVSAAEWDHVHVSSWPASDDGTPVREAMLADARAVAEAAVALVRRERPTVVARPLVVPGDARLALVNLSHDARLMVLGARGRGPLRSMLLGTVSSGVAKRAACPVVVCRPQESGTIARGVVVGADGTPESLPVIEFAFAQASLRGLPLTVLHAYWDAVAAVAGLRSGSEQVPDPSDVEELRVVLSRSVAGFSEKYPDVSVSLRLQHGLVDEVLTRGQSWGLVVVGRHPMDSVWRMLTGGIATAVLERAQSTVAIVPQT